MSSRPLRIGSICTGYGGLDLAVAEVFGGATAWISEIDPHAAAIAARHWPDVPNLGDITRVDWAAVEPVDIICGGTPCQDLSVAGTRAGMSADTRSGLWGHMRDAIDILRPSVVIWENVAGALSAPAKSRGDHDVTTSHLGPGAGSMGHGPGRPSLRAAGRVLGDLATLGYDAQWRTLRAWDVGACHLRARLFVLAWRTAGPDGNLGTRGGSQPPETRRACRGAGRCDRAPLAPLPTPTTQPTTGNGHARHLASEVPHASGDTEAIWAGTRYLDAILRHEHALGRPAPPPTIDTPRGRRLNPHFVEWMMMLPDGWVTDTPSLTRRHMLHALGNGVVPPQAAAALHDMIPHTPLATPTPYTPTRPPFPYAGGKQRLARRIIDLIAPHHHYVEPYAGALSVLLAKPPSPMETINDLDGALTTFWRVLRDRPDELIWRAATTPHSRPEHAAARDTLTDSDDLAVAHAIWVLASQGRGGRLTRAGWRHVVTAAARKSLPSYLDAYVERLADCAERLRHVSIEHRDALDVIRAYDTPKTCMYIDPPYMPGTRCNQLYREEPDEAHHSALLDLLHDCQAQIILSGYAHPLYDRTLASWHRVEIAATASSGGARTEVLWANRLPQERHL